MTAIDVLDYTGGGKLCDFWHNSALYLGNGIALLLLLMTTRNQVWSNDGDIANDLEWPLTAPSTHFCKFWGFCPVFPNSLFPTSANRHFRNFSTWRGFTRKEALLCRFPESAPNKNEGRKTPNFEKEVLLCCYITISRPPLERFRQNFAWLHSPTLLTVPNVKNFKF